MKHRIIMTLAALVCFAVGYAGNIYVEDFTLKRGDIGTLKISLTSGASGSVGVQFDVALPDGFSLAEVDNKVYSFSANQPDDLTCSVSDIGSGVSRFVLYSKSLKSLQQFELMTINIQAGSTIALQNYNISIGNVAFSDINGNVTKENGTAATVKLTDFFTLLYKVDNIDYKSYEIEYGATIIPEPEPTKDNYTFSGWSEIPTTMPAHDVTITGTFSTDIVEIDGVSYILNPDEKTARVTKCLSGEYAGSVVIPSIVTYMLEEYNVTSIGEKAFYNCTGLTSVEIPNSVLTIGQYAFYGCSGLTTVSINSNSLMSQTYWMGDIFGKQVKKYIIGNDVTTIGKEAFASCSNMNSVSIPSSVTKIGESAFYNCTGLTAVSIPGNLESIGGNVFSGCTNLTSVNLTEGLQTIGPGMFWGCSNLTSIVIPNSVTEIGSQAFSGCSSLISITIPNEVTSIGMKGFRGCSGLTSITFGNSVEYIGEYAFEGCSGLTSITLPNSLRNIGTLAFYKCTGLTSVEIPSNVTCMGDISVVSVFSMCDNLVTVTINSNDILENIGNSSRNMRHVFGDQVKTYIIGDGVTSIGDWAFYGCTDLTTVVMPNGIKSIGRSAFYECKGLTSVNIPKTVTSIEEEAFYNCTGLTSLDLSGSITTIGIHAFSGCSNLTTVILPNSVTYVSRGAFKSCTSLTDMFCYAFQIPRTEDEVFYYSNISNATLHVPTASVDIYSKTAPWKDFKNIVNIDMPKHTLTYFVDEEVYKVYDVEEGMVITPETAPTKEGYTFSGWSEIPATMPAHDVTITGTFSINSYKLTYMIDNEVYKNVTYEYGATITPEPTPEGNYATFEWTDLPQTMPAHDVVVHATYTTGITDILKGNQQDVKVYSPNGKMLAKPEKGINIIRMKDGSMKKIVVK